MRLYLTIRSGIPRGVGDTFLGIFIQYFLHPFHPFFVCGKITYRLQKYGTSKPIKGDYIAYTRTRKLCSNTFVQKHETPCVLETHGFGFWTGIDKRSEERRVG